MKRSVVLGLLVVLVTFPVTTARAGGVELGDPRTMTFAPVEFSPPEPERVVLDNGMVVYLLEDHELPLITLTATIRAGSWLDPADKILATGIQRADQLANGEAPWTTATAPMSWMGDQ